ncbi:E3 ubiquitin-protein ligase RING1-like [Triticum dicoccoides]|uniref:E3 ubiquitin-protein ligase RING1-like n=1 Tax=Triticum dicoccoides TaxID=85692 RepID=UPI000843350D|nr:E3 ubiquitin-protein ligase RING1-like [Triticum dicoccoides]XP_044422695.1 E3 ubiquitin-protein ligase RING1-like [Triticum aestivum]
MPLKLALTVVAPAGMTCGILKLAGVPWPIVIRIAGVLLAFLFIAALCQRAQARARSQRQLLQDPEGDRSSMAALPREPAVGLGQAAIAGLPVYKYEKLSCGGGEGHECAVCLAEVRPKEVVKQLPACTHLFHDRCIDEWLWSHRTCPVCRSPVDASTVPDVEVAARAMQSV